MNIVYLTTEDPLYLPGFFDRVFSSRRTSSTVITVPPLYGKQTTLDAARRYVKTFGLTAAYGLARRALAAKVRRQSIGTVCRRYSVPYRRASDVNDIDALETIRGLSPDVIVSVSCPQIFKRELIDLAPLGCLNIHGAILPHYRGVLPSFWMLANGERQAGVSVFFVNDEIDGGELCGQRTFDIGTDDTLDTLLKRSKSVAAEVLLDVLVDVEQGTAQRSPLDVRQGSYYSWPSTDAVRQFFATGRRIW